jgi:hypothetical protein
MVDESYTGHGQQFDQTSKHGDLTGPYWRQIGDTTKYMGMGQEGWTNPY